MGDPGQAALKASNLFPFTQFHFASRLGPDDGTYTVRSPAGGGAQLTAGPTVVIFATVGAPSYELRPRRIRRRRAGKPQTSRNGLDLEGSRSAARNRVTVTRPEAFASKDAAASWLRQLSKDEDQREVEVEFGLAAINRVLGAYRIAAADPYAIEVDRSSPFSARIGYGAGHAITAGSWDEALLAPPGRTKRAKRIEVLHPQVRVAALLAGRERALVGEELVLRARLDLDHGRPRQAALQLDTGLEALLLELGDDVAAAAGEDASKSEAGRARADAQREDIASLRDAVAELENAADRALTGDLGPEAQERLAEVLGRCERVLRRRHYGLS